MNLVIDVPFKADPRKMLRFKAYALEKDCQLVPFDVPNNMMTGSQLLQEKREFEHLLHLNK